MDTIEKLRLYISKWYEENKRELPWRSSSDPYKIWISEIILQQTQVKQGTNYYLRFIEQFPNISTLASASEQNILKAWEGLGYYSRARNMHTAAKQIMQDHKGIFPNKHDQIIALKGIGEYTAAAISSIAFNLPYAVVDGNVARVLSRLFRIKDPINANTGIKQLRAFSDALLNKDDPGHFNQAIMEFGALHCKPKTPNCSECTLREDCLAFKYNETTLLPIKNKKIKQKKRFFLYLIFNTTKGLWLKKRSGKDIWEGLYEFPMVESEMAFNDSKVLTNIQQFCGIDSAIQHIQSISPEITHVLSHQKIMTRFVHIKNDLPKQLKSEYLFVPNKKLPSYPFPRLINRYLQSQTLDL